MPSSAYKLIPDSFTPIPSHSAPKAALTVVAEPSPQLEAIGYAVTPEGNVHPSIGLSREALTAAGFNGKIGETLVLVRGDGPVAIAIGIGADDARTASGLRDAAAAFARAAHRYSRLGLQLVDAFPLEAEERGAAAVEGVLLARYRYTVLQANPSHTPLGSLELATTGDADAVLRGAEEGRILAEATNLARDLANTPPGHLTATDFGEVALSLAAEFGLEVEVFDKQQLIELGCGGILGVNAGSAEEPRLITVKYSPATPSGHLSLVGKGIMYDSGGISLKPSNPMHLAMKMDMAGAAAVFGAMTTLRALGCTTAVTGYLVCTDNMPSGSATKLGDVLTIRGGTTVEVKNTDAEGRLVLADALVLARESDTDAIVDIATLTGGALMALGTTTAALYANDDALAALLREASETSNEQLWRMPLERRYREQLKSDVADLSNMGGPYAGATNAALFLADFVGDVPWAHLDIAGTMQSEKDDSWRSKGATGFGTRMLVELARRFERADR